LDEAKTTLQKDQQSSPAGSMAVVGSGLAPATLLAEG
jgi:hypothetical protein